MEILQIFFSANHLQLYHVEDDICLELSLWNPRDKLNHLEIYKNISIIVVIRANNIFHINIEQKLQLSR